MPAFYRSTVPEFAGASDGAVLGALAAAHAATGLSELDQRQTVAWQHQIAVLRSALAGAVAEYALAGQWGLLLEYPVPRRHKRIDAVVLASGVVVVLEFKTGRTFQASEARRQVEDYALDLRDFHEASCHRAIVPVVVGPAVNRMDPGPGPAADDVRRVVFTSDCGLKDTLLDAVRTCSVPERAPLDLAEWDESPYRPVPTIIEAASLLYAGHDVREIAHAHADAHNLTRTVDVLLGVAAQTELKATKAICFVTGVPGAGKTLAGLNAVHAPGIRSDGRPASVFLSGNGPLVRIIREALARDHAQRSGIAIGRARRETRTFVQNVHEFIGESTSRDSDRAPYEKVIVLDEAQRMWNAHKNRRKFGRDVSEPQMVLDIMGRHTDWALVIALVGGGQEIHDGEAGLAEWGRVLSESRTEWQVFVSPEALQPGASLAGRPLFDGQIPDSLAIVEEPSLHLSVSIRSYKAEALASWVDAVLAGEERRARQIVDALPSFPVWLTRQLPKAKAWLRQMMRGHRRCGLVASSGAARLRAEGIEVSSAFRRGYPYDHWFLACQDHVSSSCQLEAAATEFEIQGLELDSVGVCWGGDLLWEPGTRHWRFRTFVGTEWRNVHQPQARGYLVNKYRVLLTRAREAAVIWVPTGDSADRTRDPTVFDSTADYLIRCGAQPMG